MSSPSSPSRRLFASHHVNPNILLGENPRIILWMSDLDTAAKGNSDQNNWVGAPDKMVGLTHSTLFPGAVRSRTTPTFFCQAVA
jgi:hypothetical protein